MRTLFAVVPLVVLAACGTDEPLRVSDEQPAVTPTGSPTESPEVEVDDLADDLGDDPLVTLTSQQVCDALSVDAATVALGTEVAQAEASDSATPQCTYTYGGDSASLSTFTVAVQRPDDVGGRGLADAFEHVLSVNRELAAETPDSEVEEVPVDAGDAAVRLTGDTLTLTVVASAGHLVTIITTPDLGTDAVEALGAAAADAVA